MMLVSSHSSLPAKLGRQLGVTLIELLVVITIMMSILSLVAPVAINAVEKAEAQDEYLALCGWIRSSSMTAFANGSGIEILLDGDSITFSSVANVHKVHNIKYLKFQKQVLILNRNGISDLDSISVMQRDKIKKVDLRLLLEGDGA